MARQPRPNQPAARRTVEATVTALGGRGDGIARVGDELFYIPYTVPGDRVLARTEGRRGDGWATALVEVLGPGPERIGPACRHFGTCGGCALQHLAADAYRRWKREVVVAALARQGLAAAPVVELAAVPPGTRRRAAFTYARRHGSVRLGFNARASHHLVDLAECPVLDARLVTLLPALRRLLAGLDPAGPAGDIVASVTEGGIDMMIEAPGALDLSARERLADFAAAADLARIAWRGPAGVEPVARRRPPLVRFAGIAVEPPPGAFLQASVEGERLIVDQVTAAVGAAGRVADLFAGCGTLTFPLARSNRVHAVEGEAGPVMALRAAADAAGLAITTEGRDLFRRPLLGAELRRYDAVVFDPPRAGAAEQAAALAAGGPALVVAVSCHPASLARDLRLMVEGGYRVERLVPIDQFPWSAHVEAVAVLRR